jgi:hypothetical protein
VVSPFVPKCRHNSLDTYACGAGGIRAPAIQRGRGQVPHGAHLRGVPLSTLCHERSKLGSVDPCRRIGQSQAPNRVESAASLAFSRSHISIEGRYGGPSQSPFAAPRSALRAPCGGQEHAPPQEGDHRGSQASASADVFCCVRRGEREEESESQRGGLLTRGRPWGGQWYIPLFSAYSPAAACAMAFPAPVAQSTSARLRQISPQLILARHTSALPHEHAAPCVSQGAVRRVRANACLGSKRAYGEVANAI